MWQSQLQVIHTLLEAKNQGEEFVVFNEGLVFFDLDIIHRYFSDEIQEARQLFLLNGIPKNFNDLNRNQKDFLYEHGRHSYITFLRKN